ncbi:hypothetical protein CQW23_31991 [Capsicum baccatum]|uniref:AN1-type domain-containing protein n=1 Tax=Capsicum baccatum TaxID=33114 RepID=A0A2G2V5Z1_CAPBA|nr:hypothetical protein CQW23_31991 [Capsicum baccatum]
MESSKETGCRAPEKPVLCINDCDFFGSVANVNMFSKCQKDIILLKQEIEKLAAASNKDVIRRSSSRNELELVIVGVVDASADLASQISQAEFKEGLKKCTASRKRVGLMGFSYKCGDLFCAVDHYSDKHNCRLIIGMLSIATSLHLLPFSVSATQHLGPSSGSGFADCELDEVLSSSKDRVLSFNHASHNVILLDFAEIHSTISASSWSSGLLNTSSSFVLLFFVSPSSNRLTCSCSSDHVFALELDELGVIVVSVCEIVSC